MKNFGPPPTATDRLRDMKPKTEMFIEDIKPQTVKAIASRIGTESIPRRRYVTRQEDGGIRVWRLA